MGIYDYYHVVVLMLMVFIEAFDEEEELRLIKMVLAVRRHWYGQDTLLWWPEGLNEQWSTDPLKMR